MVLSPTSNEMLILGLIASAKLINKRFNPENKVHLTKLSGKQLEFIIEKNKMRHWTQIGISSIYAILKRLEKLKYIESFSETTGSPPTRSQYYNVTPNGLDYLSGELKAILSTVTPLVDIFSIGFGFSHLLSTKELKTSLEKRLLALKKQEFIFNERFSEIPHNDDEVQRIFTNLFNRGQFHIEAEIKWLRQFINDLNKSMKKDIPSNIEI